MKRLKRGTYLIILIILLNIINVLAYSHYGSGSDSFFGFGNVGGFIEQIGSNIGQILAPIIGPAETGEFLFAKILLFFLLFAIIFVALNNIDIFSSNRVVHVTLTLIVSIFAVRYIKEGNFINAILLPYSALGVAISIFLPLLIYFYFVHFSGIGPFGRRIAWIIYAITFLVLWGSRTYDPIGAGPTLGTANWIYFIGIGFLIVNILFDRSIHRYLGLSGLERWRERSEDARVARLQAEHEEIRGVDSPQARRRRKFIELQLRRYGAWNY